LGRGLEPLHLPLSPSRRPMRILGSVIQISARSVPDIGQDFAMRHTVAAQAISDEAPRLVFQPVQQSLEKALEPRGVPAVLHEDIEYDPVLVHRPPEIVQRAVDADEHLVEVPGVSGPGSFPPPVGARCSRCGGSAWWSEAGERRFGWRCACCCPSSRPAAELVVVETQAIERAIVAE
jgi:hypothetical protein